MKKVWFGLIIILLIIVFPVYAETENNKLINEKNTENEEIVEDTFPLLNNDDSSILNEEKQDINSNENSKNIIIVHYLGEDKKVLSEDTIIEKESNETYEIFPKDFDNYILIDTIGKTKGIINKDLDITFIYKENETVEIDDRDYVEEKDIEEDEYKDQSEEFLTDGMFLSMGAVREIPASIENPNTGDDINIYFYLSIISIISITNILILRKKLVF